MLRRSRHRRTEIGISKACRSSECLRCLILDIVPVAYPVLFDLERCIEHRRRIPEIDLIVIAM